MQQSDKHGPVQDEYLKHDAEDAVRSGRATDGEDWVDDPEPAAAPAVATVGSIPPPAAPPGMTPREVEERSLLARYLGPAVFPGSTSELVATLREHNAPGRFISRVEALPANRKFTNIREVAEGLGLHVEAQRF
jgi:hypothetical protein